jgi:hypothetical protein
VRWCDEEDADGEEEKEEIWEKVEWKDEDNGRSIRCRLKPRTRVGEPAMASWVEFPKLSPAGKGLMETVAETMNRELGELLLPLQTTPDVRSFLSGNVAGSMMLRAGREGSKVHCPILSPKP